MDMDLDDSSAATSGVQKGKRLLVMLVGAPGSGKSTLCENVMRASKRPWVRVCQDIIGNGKSGTKAQCLKSALSALDGGKNVFIDRCNLDKEQRTEFVKLGSPQIDVHAVVLDLPAQLCISRSVKRIGHEGNLQGGKAAAVVNRMLQKKELPKLNEGFSRIMFCHNDAEIQDAINTYNALGPFDDLPHGCFGERNHETKIQAGIMKFMKKIDGPSGTVPKESRVQSPAPHQSSDRTNHKFDRQGDGIGSTNLSEKQEKGNKETSICPSSDIPTLAFPSISTADFQFDHDKASDIIVEKVGEFISKLGNARLVLVDLSHGSKILSLVKAKAARKNIDSSKFFTFVGNIVNLSTKGGLCCSVIANAANWRLKSGGGGVNAAIFNAAGADLEAATRARAKMLHPGQALVVPLPSASPLYLREGVTHVIHVLGPNMNPQRPNCLDNDYNEGCKLLRQAYTSLFEGFMSILKMHGNELKPSQMLRGSDCHLDNCKQDSDQKNKRSDEYLLENSKKSRCSPVDTRDGEAVKGNERSRAKGWSSWSQALYQIAMHPERHKGDILELTKDVIVIKDCYPKACKHLLVLARAEHLDCLSDVREEHLELLRRMHGVGLKWAEKFLQEDDPSLVFRLGYHSVPSMQQLHLHVISQDFNSTHLKNKKHWNSFNTAFFRDSVDVIEEVSSNGEAGIHDEGLLAMELRCHRCRSAHPNIPRLKWHIGSCKAAFPVALLENGRLVFRPTSAMATKP
ncbi:hypothetical protein SAY87_031826 [Trapa incisa]|uniref:Macro domain-containing protein n=1 Tax=Trapa incisa TaxID=236973 RepID=A0AAN7KRT7_9MYRT|nr:hypothetical protein SAY87_031826 [Trapa incisa]